MASQHIVRSFEEELNHVHDLLAQMGTVTTTQISSAIQALADRNSDLAAEVITGDREVDKLESKIDDLAVKMLALRQPMALDLRVVVSALKISSDLERIADYAANVAKRAIALNQVPFIPPVIAIPGMGKLARQMVEDVLDAFARGDVESALKVWSRDEELDEMYSSVFRELLGYRIVDPGGVTAATHVLFVAKNIERIGDHATNIAEKIHFMIVGQPLTGARPKHDESSFAVAKPNGCNT